MEAAVTAAIEIRKLGLTVATNKTEAMWFHGLTRNRNPPTTWLSIGEDRIKVGMNIKYLGVILETVF